MKNLLSCFKAYKDKSVREGKTKPTLSDVFIKLFALAIKEYPIINSTFTDAEIVIHKDINIGLAVAVDNGLIVPNIKNADKKTLPQITEERLMLVNKARQGRLGGDDIKGGTFTISNLGGFEVEYATPIINHPERAVHCPQYVPPKQEPPARDLFIVEDTSPLSFVVSAETALSAIFVYVFGFDPL